MAESIGIEVFLSPYSRSAAPPSPGIPSVQATWPASTATLIEGENDAVLVDGLMTLAEGSELTAWIRHSGKRLTAAYVTHARADQFFGLEPVLAAFPDAPLVAFAQVASAAAEQVDAASLAVGNSFFPGQISDHPAVPIAMPGEELLLEDRSLNCVLVGQSDVEQSSVVHVPWLDAVVAGDVAYNRVHMWLAGPDPKTRAAWIESLNAVERLQPETVIAGHKDPDAPDDDAIRILDESRQYIRDFDDIVKASDSALGDRHEDAGQIPGLG